MTIVVAHHLSPSGFVALREAGAEASRRYTDLVVIHVVERRAGNSAGYPDHLDIDQDYRDEMSAEIQRVLDDGGFPDLSWDLRMSTADVTTADSILALADQVDAEMLVIGSQRRTLRGDDQLGTAAQTIVAQAHVPVVVTKPAVPLSERG